MFAISLGNLIVPLHLAKIYLKKLQIYDYFAIFPSGNYYIFKFCSSFKTKTKTKKKMKKMIFHTIQKTCVVRK